MGKRGRNPTGGWPDVEAGDLGEAATAHMNQFPDETKGYRVSNSDTFKPEFRGDYFEVTSDTITYSYGDVWWKHFPTVPIPEDVIGKLASESLMISGLEANLMRRDEDGNEVIVPAYETYNHHVTVTFRGAADDGTVPHFTESDPMLGGHAKFQVEKLDGPGWESVQQFLGAEMRGTFFYSPEGYDMRIDHPRDITIEGMFINTGKPGGGRCTFPSDECPEPVNSAAPAGANWSGLLECPCTDRIERTVFGYVPAFSDTCEIPVESAADCWDGAEEMGYTGTTWLLDDESYPSGCFVLADRENVQIGYNKAQSGASCNQVPEEQLFVGSAKLLDESSFYTEVNFMTGQVTTTITGPADKWFGFGVGTDKMNGAVAYIAQADGDFHTRILGNHHPGNKVDGIVDTVLSNTVVDGVRTVVFMTILGGQRRMEMQDAASSGGTQEAPLIAAVGYGPTLGYHWKKASGKFLYLGNNVPECVCRADPEHPAGTIDNVVFSHTCPEQLLAENNPTCNLLDYDGGMMCCRHGVVLLDSDQEQPQTEDEVYVKLRVYYEPEVTTGGSTVVYYAPEGVQREYHIPEGLVHGFSTHLLKQTKTAEEIFDFSGGDHMKLVFAQGHCHAPQCIRQELWNEDTNEMLCSTDMTYGDNDEAMNEAGYIIGSSVCIWGSEDGLKAPPVFTKSTRITTRKYADAETYHHGDMAGWIL